MRKFVRTRGAAPAAAAAAAAAPTPAPPHAHAHAHAPVHKSNGHTNGAAPRDPHHAPRDPHHHAPRSTLSSRCGATGSARREVEGGALWEDAQFPAARGALGCGRRGALGVVWMRPYELCSRPTFRGEGAARGDQLGTAGCEGQWEGDGEGDGEWEGAEDEPEDELAARWSVQVGAVGAAGLCAAAAALALAPRLLARVAPPQAFGDHYTGAFRFRFWVFGSWREVVVDDRLPTRGGRLLASRGALPADFTLPLLEKAYAKLYGSYAAARGGGDAGGSGSGSGSGGVARALQELTGGVVQSFLLARQPRALTAQVLHSAVPRSTLLVATLHPEKEGAWRRQRNGLISGQAYCVTGLARVRPAGAGAGAEGEALVRVRAPGGGGGAWAGAWARHSAEWRALGDADRDLLAQRAQRPGDFWMSMSDFSRAFSSLVLVHVGPDEWVREPALRARRPWRAVLARRRWRAGYNAGGPPACAATTAANPQFHVRVPTAAGSGAGAARRCHVVVSVTQQYEPAGGDAALLAIGFAVYELPAGAAPRRPADSFAGLRALDVTHESRAREVATFFTLPAGQYLLVPHTRRAHAEAAFLLRVLTDHQTDVWEVNDDNMIVHNMSSEFLNEPQNIPAAVRAAAARLLPPGEELDARALRRAVRGWAGCGGGGGGGASRELCRALVALRDARLAGAVSAGDAAALLALLAAWRGAVARACGRRCSAYRLRALLAAAGVRASNKVLEALVLRHAERGQLSLDACLVVLARLHLAHERFRSLDTKLKSNPLSLEEMILMTIYS